MPQNVEIKARVHDWAALHAAAERLSGGLPQRIVQVDTFFVVPHGRLKLREFSPKRGELIFYERPDTREAKASRYAIVPTHRPRELCGLLSASLGMRGEVRKERWLYLVGQTRIHLDRVEGLGDFLELEVVLRDEQSIDEGRRIADALQKELGVDAADLIDGAYIDLLAATQSACPGSSPSPTP
jgi:predicted adenylyl cyclase CyaB